MNCARWQEKIALFTGADLPAHEAAAVEAHLEVCGACREFERELSEVRAMLLSARAIDDSDVAPVRSAVLVELQRRPRRSAFAWMPYAAAAAFAALILGWATSRTPELPMPPLPHGPSFVNAAQELRASASRGAVRRGANPKARVKPQPRPPAEPTVITLFTEDPDVVIVWITD